MITAELAKSKALEITQKFPKAKTVTEAYDYAVAEKMFSNKDEALAVQGRLDRMLPQQVA